jgi:hypothetical protein
MSHEEDTCHMRRRIAYHGILVEDTLFRLGCCALGSLEAPHHSVLAFLALASRTFFTTPLPPPRRRTP